MSDEPSQPQQFRAIYDPYALPKLKEPPTFLQHSGVYFMRLLLFVISFLAFVCFIWVIATCPNMTDAQETLQSVHGDKLPDGWKAKDSVELLAAMRDQHFGYYRDLLQLVLGATLVPLFTLIAGYVFAKAQDSESNAKSDEA